MDDPYNLDRFLQAQAAVFETALAELRAGRKRTHWMWFVFPQIAGLGVSPTAQFYAIGSVEEAKAYDAHPLLGPRLRRCTETMTGLSGLSAHAVLGRPDDLKFHSSMTLFALTASDPAPFRVALAKYFHGREDPATLARLR